MFHWKQDFIYFVSATWWSQVMYSLNYILNCLTCIYSPIQLDYVLLSHVLTTYIHALNVPSKKDDNWEFWVNQVVLRLVEGGVLQVVLPGEQANESPEGMVCLRGL